MHLVVLLYAPTLKQVLQIQGVCFIFSFQFIITHDIDPFPLNIKLKQRRNIHHNASLFSPQ